MTAEPPDLAEIEKALARKGLGLRFPRRLEAAYLGSYLAQRAPLVPLWAAVGTLLYCMGYLGDQTMMAPNSDLLFALRFGIFLPYGLAVIALMRFMPGPRLYEALSVGVGLLGALLPMSVLAVTQSPYAFIYQTGTVSTLLYFVVLLRPRFYAVVLGCLGILAIQLIATAINGSFDEVTYTGIVTFYCTFTAFLVLSAHALERSARRSFLHDLKNEILTARLRYQSEHDALTGLYNRRALSARIDALWNTPDVSPLSVIMLDIDHFKLYNDTHGHMAGDNCLRIVSRTVLETLGERGQAFRYGGEEMLILLPRTPLATATDLAEAMRQSILKAAIPHRDSDDPAGIITASFGVAEADPALFPAMALLSQADDALYQAKRLGRNRIYPPRQNIGSSNATGVAPLAQEGVV